jgi:hypothetical protein
MLLVRCGVAVLAIAYTAAILMFGSGMIGTSEFLGFTLVAVLGAVNARAALTRSVARG